MEHTFTGGISAEGKVEPRTGTDTDTGSFRRLLDDELSPEEYVERLDERVRERREADEAAQSTGDREESETPDR